MVLSFVFMFWLSLHILQSRHYNKRYSRPSTCTAKECTLQTPLPYTSMAPNLLLILIHSGAKSGHVRDIVRSTWVSQLKRNVAIQYRFVVGVSKISQELMTKVKDESRAYNDIMVLDDVTDSKASLSQRTLDSFSLAVSNFEFRYVLKCDDDSIVDVPRIATELQQRERSDRLYWGYFSGAKFLMKIGPYTENKWFICEKYTPIAAGGGYILSRDVITLLTLNKDLVTWYVAEDATVSAALSPYNIERKHDTRFNTPGWPSRGCKDPYLITHKIEPQDIYSLYQSLIMEGCLCSQRTRWHLYMGYLYNWTALPSKCCYINHGLP